MKFEEVLIKIDEIVKNLENQNLPLDQSIAEFNCGVKLSKQCIEILNDSKAKISIITNEMNEICEKDFNLE